MADVPPVPRHWRFPARPSSVSQARHAVTEALPGQLMPTLQDNLSLLTSELVTNAIRYGSQHDGELVELVLWSADGHYWLAVSGPGSGGRAPALARRDADAESGRGLLLVDQIAAAWAVRPRPTRGTSVIAGLPLHRHE
ncbi:ATP-binding protein [Streptomyces sp. 7-21]|jgi:anti-sigma regulatory factor (Ser/Thr protein kinase)|nr:ATP-binding protein [Streptomyces sp. 7-21]